MISFLSILLWNSEHPRYLDILLFRQDLPRLMRGAGMDCQDAFPVFHLDKDRVGNWLRVGVTKFGIDIK